MLGAYITRVVFQLPIAERNCKDVWPYVVEFLQYFNIFDIIEDNKAERLAIEDTSTALALFEGTELTKSASEAYEDAYNTILDILNTTGNYMSDIADIVAYMYESAGWLELWSDFIMIIQYYDDRDYMMMGLFSGTTSVRLPMTTCKSWNFVAEIFGWPLIDVDEILDF